MIIGLRSVSYNINPLEAIVVTTLMNLNLIWKEFIWIELNWSEAKWIDLNQLSMSLCSSTGSSQGNTGGRRGMDITSHPRPTGSGLTILGESTHVLFIIFMDAKHAHILVVDPSPCKTPDSMPSCILERHWVSVSGLKSSPAFLKPQQTPHGDLSPEHSGSSFSVLSSAQEWGRCKSQ